MSLSTDNNLLPPTCNNEWTTIKLFTKTIRVYKCASCEVLGNLNDKEDPNYGKEKYGFKHVFDEEPSRGWKCKVCFIQYCEDCTAGMLRRSEFIGCMFCGYVLY